MSHIAIVFKNIKYYKMKNSLQLASFLLIVICSFIFQTNMSAQIQIENLNSNKNRLYVSPLNLVNINGASAQITYGRVISERHEIQFSYSQRLGYFNPIFKAEEDADNLETGLFILLGNDHAEFKYGFRFGLENQFFLSSNKYSTNYVGLELFYERDQIDFIGSSFLIFSKKTEFQLTRSKIGLNLKLGKKIQLTESLLFDIYFGLGLKRVHYDYQNHEDQFSQYPLNDGIKKWKVNLPLNFKFAYSF